MDSKAIYLLATIVVQITMASIYHGPIAKPVVLKSGYLEDTHEVASAKGAHLAALAEESHHGHGGDYSGAYGHGGDYLSYNHGQVVRYHGPTARPVVLKSGYLEDTHEVSATNAAHLVALAEESRHGHGGDYVHSYGQDSKYHGPTAVPHVLKSGYLADTDDVAAAKVTHLVALAEESRHGHGGDYVHSYGQDSKYHGPTAKPVVLKSGYLEDTREVSAAKGAHLAALAEESHHGHGGDHSGSSGRGHDLRYHGPTAVPHVLKTGHIADTHEVAAAKAEHHAAVSKAKAHGGFRHHGEPLGLESSHRYHAAVADPTVLPSGYLADTR